MSTDLSRNIRGFARRAAAMLPAVVLTVLAASIVSHVFF